MQIFPVAYTPPKFVRKNDGCGHILGRYWAWATTYRTDLSTIIKTIIILGLYWIYFKTYLLCRLGETQTAKRDKKERKAKTEEAETVRKKLFRGNEIKWDKGITRNDQNKLEGEPYNECEQWPAKPCRWREYIEAPRGSGRHFGVFWLVVCLVSCVGMAHNDDDVGYFW